MIKDIKNGRDKELNVEFVNEELRISIGIDVLAFAIKYAPDWPEKYLVYDTEKFAHSMMLALNQEQEDGTTPIHRMFDGSAMYALEQGYEGFAEIVNEEELNDNTV